jgi:hypothetical protein
MQRWRYCLTITMETAFSIWFVPKRYKQFVYKLQYLQLHTPIFSSERMLRKDYYRKGSVKKERSLVVSLKGLVAKTN